MTLGNTLYFGDCLDVMREDIPDNSVDLIYLDPPFNSKRLHNASIGGSQWVAFKDTWQWHEAVDDFHQTASRIGLAPTMEGLRLILSEGPDLAYLSYMANRLVECHRVLRGGGGIYLHSDPTMSHYLRIVMNAVFGKRNFRNEIVWDYRTGGVSKRYWPRKHDNILFYVRSNRYIHRPLRERIYYDSDFFGVQKDAYGRYYADVFVRDTWSDIKPVINVSKERLGYPTQKPVKLLERILRASCPPDGVVLDPFSGCGTTLHAAQNLGLRWVGIDICVNACQIIEQRLRGSFEALWDDVQFVGMPKTRDDAKTLANINPQ